LAGFGYGAGVLRFAFDLVGLANELPVPDSTRSKATDKPLPDDLAGKETVKYLQRTKRAVQLILSNEKLSLGLHPALYFYTAGGTFQAAALHNAIAWVLDLEKRGKLQWFLNVRGAFEEIVLSHPVVIKPESHKLGSGTRTRSKMLALFARLLELLTKNQDPEWAWKSIVEESPDLAVEDKKEKEKSAKGKSGGRFTRGAKSAAFLAGLPNISRCKLCGGLLHRNGMVADHEEERAAGGSSSSQNARWVHPACNSNRKKMNEQAK